MDKYNSVIKNSVEKNLPELLQIKGYLYDNPEIGGTEEKASAVLIKSIKSHGFDVEEKICGVPYSFKAVYDTGVPGPVIGYCAEYDALPEIGHGCGHNLIAAVSMGAAIALKDAMPCGKVVLFGTPAEENRVSKATMADMGAFNDIGVCMMVHPSDKNGASAKTTAIDAHQVEFYGKAAHAGSEPEKGINALDAAVDFYTLLRENTPDDVNIHGVIKDGGVRASIIPDKAIIQYMCRSYSSDRLKDVSELFEKYAKTVAEKYGATYKIWDFEPPNKDMVTNEALSAVFNEAYEKAGGGVMPYREASGGSTDMGDVSKVCPAIHSWVGLGCIGVNGHSKEFAEATMTEYADKVVAMSAEALAETGIRVLTDEGLFAKIRKEFYNNPETEGTEK